MFFSLVSPALRLKRDHIHPPSHKNNLVRDDRLVFFMGRRYYIVAFTMDKHKDVPSYDSIDFKHCGCFKALFDLYYLVDYNRGLYQIKYLRSKLNNNRLKN